jgi:hypothetical protein
MKIRVEEAMATALGTTENALQTSLAELRNALHSKRPLLNLQPLQELVLDSR